VSVARRVTCFWSNLVPIFLFEKSERLSGRPTRRPGLYCSTDRRCSEVDSDTDSSGEENCRKNQTRKATRSTFFRWNQVEIVLTCTNASLCVRLAKAWGLAAHAGRLLGRDCGCNAGRVRVGNYCVFDDSDYQPFGGADPHRRWNALSWTPWKTARLGAPEAYGANQPLALQRTQPEHAEETTGDRRGLRSDRAIYLDVVDNVLDITAA
jgi:hypothetical protein